MKKVITVKISSQLDNKMLKKVIDKGYGMRGKSKWIAEAIERLIGEDGFADYVQVASESENNDKTISMRLDKALIQKIDNAIVKVRKTYPTLEGVQSNIVRASIYQALLR